MTTTTAPFLRPLRLSELLDQAIRLYRNHFLKFIGILALPYIPLMIFQLLASLLTTHSIANQFGGATSPEEIFRDPSYLGGVFGSLGIGLLQFFLVQGVATAALTRAVADTYTGRSVGILASYGRVGNSWLKLIASMLLMFFIIMAAFLWLLIPCVGWISGLGLVIFLGLVVYPLLIPVVVLEHLGIGGSLRRAWDLARSRFWWLIGFAFVLYLFAQLVVSGPTYVISLLAQILSPMSQLSTEQLLVWRTVLQSLVAMLSSLLYLPLQLTAMTLVYFDLRVRSEGLDLALLSSGPVEAGETPLPEISGHMKTSFITGRDFGYFVLLTMGGTAVFILFYSILLGAVMLLASAASV